MKIFLILILTATFALNISAREKCELSVNAAPTLFNLKLGMSGAQAKRAVSNRLNIKNIKTGTFFQNFINNSPPPNLNGIRAVYLRFFDSKLYQIEIFYANENANLENFVRDFSARENLPFEFWQIAYGNASLECEGFSIKSNNYLNPRIELTDELINAQFEESQKKKKEN